MTLPEILARRAHETPHRTAYVFVDERGEPTRTLTYAELHALALGVAAALPCPAGERALLVFPQCAEFAIAFLGCLYAGVVAVPVSPPRRGRVQDATAAVIADCAPAVVLGLSTGPDVADLPRLDVDRLGAGTGSPRPRDLAFLQYTSGSTGDPKGVMVTHANLAANEEMIAAAFGHDEESTVVGWAPFFHDQGLIGNLLQPIWVGARGIMMSPMAFVRRPLLWLELVSRHRAHTSGGPNFAFDACVAAAARGPVPTMDLSCWKVAFNGAEPVRPETVRAFAETFAPHGFDAAAMHPCYGLAEATLIVTGTGRMRGPRTVAVDPADLARNLLTPGAKELVGSGAVLPRETVKIVDPETGAPRPEGGVGEIAVAGPAVARRYWGRPPHLQDGFLRTGDLGAFVDGELYVVGRIKDVAIIRGRNHHPSDLEHTVAAAHPALQPGAGAAFTVDDRLVVVQEVRRDHRRTGDPREVTGAVRAALAREHGLSADLVVTLPGRVPKTSSGKVRRAAAAAIHAGDGFEPWETGP
ncbi:fatty acyl-AMP ligase [Pseudonocardia sp. WMMC193]|uniref:fatty acyl-AMP ligase n=1 Tax=Pseudonocardia sp. WMMC193 TaxID=2911965 RepID=UPI001F1D09E0|nr:fatty acyl-AMP ligase [Pseudonocardia sp. WMMC193]MCF7548575.1 fatty acyl-AMP ligase [Pseudonocardia sp. WMMC193]